MKLLNDRGNVMLVGLMVISAATTVGFTLMTFNQSNAEESNVWYQKKQSFFLSEGLQSISKETLKKFMIENPKATIDDMNTKLKDVLPKIAEGAHFKLENVQITKVEDIPSQPLTEGPFAGVVSPQRIVDFDILVERENSLMKVPISSFAQVSLNMYNISPFQFMMYSDLDYTDLMAGGDTKFLSRVHFNGDVCLSAKTNLYLTKLTSSGRVMLHGNKNCRNASSYAGKVYVSSVGSDASYLSVNSGADHGCVNCENSKLNWMDYAYKRWAGNLKDISHDVFKTWLSFANDAPVQFAFVSGASSDNYSGSFSSNTGKMRYLLDPVVFGESSSTADSKMAMQADLRIIDGVWFIKDPEDPKAWPGIPVWSDHPGQANSAITGGYSLTKVGQGDIQTYWADKGKAWPSAGGIPSAPKLYSFYETDFANGKMTDDVSGVISYGSLINNLQILSPGFLITSNGPHSICPAGTISYSGGTKKGIQSTEVSCLNADGTLNVKLNSTTLKLLSARSGFKNPHTLALNVGSAAERDSAAKVLPMNFDLDAFQKAMASTAPGELGSYFGDSTSFNGIVYISVSWPGSLDGLSQGSLNKGFPVVSPPQGGTSVSNPFVFNGQVDGSNNPLAVVNQPSVVDSSQQQALPFQLCSSASPASTSTVKAGNGFDDSGSFKIPYCNDYENKYLRAFPNAVRVINGKNIDRTILPKGITIVSNVGLFVAGDFNSNSDGSSEAATAWIPTMLAGDQVAVQSNAWDDTFGSWGNDLSAWGQRSAATTKIVASILSGWTRHVDAGTNTMTVSSESFPATMENWGGVNLELQGAIALGFYPVYMKHGLSDNRSGIMVMAAPTRKFAYDPHLNSLSKQPIGSPLIPVMGIQSYRRDSFSTIAEKIAATTTSPPSTTTTTTTTPGNGNGKK